VRVQVAQARDAILVPSVALQRTGNQYQVLVPGSDPAAEPQAVNVEIGISDGVNTQILKGLNVGDKVVVRYTRTTSATTTRRQQSSGLLGQFSTMFR